MCASVIHILAVKGHKTVGEKKDLIFFGHKSMAELLLDRRTKIVTKDNNGWRHFGSDYVALFNEMNLIIIHERSGFFGDATFQMVVLDIKVNHGLFKACGIPNLVNF